jgi:hypothetical protein
VTKSDNPASASGTVLDQPKGSKEQTRPAQGAQRDQDRDRPGMTQDRNQRPQGAQRGQDRDQPGMAQDRDQRPQGAQRDERPSAQPGKSGSPSTAQGQSGSSGASVTLNAEQKTKIRQTIIQKNDAPRVSKVNFSLNVGTVVPRARVRLVAVPPTLVEIHPAWRGYLYFVVGDQLIVVEPSSHRIVAVITV